MKTPFRSAESAHGETRTRRVVLESQGAPRIGMLNRESSFPKPDLSGPCVCCDAPPVESIGYDPSDGALHAAEIAVPVCEPCWYHLRRSNAVERVLAVLMLPGIVVAGLGLIGMRLAVFTGGVALVALPIAALVLRGGQARKQLRRGHHVALGIRAGEGWCVVETSNRRLVDALLERHRPIARLAGEGQTQGRDG